MTDPERELLRRIHKVLLYILLAFDKVCRENNLTYFLDSGTALGAVRHKGFIPWDDDVDVGMPRKDYELFLQIAQEELPEDIFLQTHKTDSAYERNAAKLRLKGTTFDEDNGMPYKENGFYIDIFPFDNIPNNGFIVKIYITILGKIYRIINSWYGRIKSKSRLRSFIQLIIKIVPESYIEFLNNKYVKCCRKYEDCDTGFMTCHFWGMTYIGGNAYIFDKKRMLPVQEVSFEGYNLKIVNDPDYYLGLIYGDYMQLPPKDQQCCRHARGDIFFGGEEDINDF